MVKSNITMKELDRIVKRAAREQKLAVTSGGVPGTYFASAGGSADDFAMAFVVTLRVRTSTNLWKLLVNVQALRRHSCGAQQAREFTKQVKAKVAGRRIKRDE